MRLDSEGSAGSGLGQVRNARRLRGGLAVAVATAAALVLPAAAPYAAAGTPGPPSATHTFRWTAIARSPGRTATVEETRDAVPAYRVNSSLTSAVAGATAKPPYRKLWSRNFPGAISSPLTVGDRVFAVIDAASPADPGPLLRLVGIDARTGKDLWPQKPLTTRAGATLTYGGGLVYTQTMDGVVAAWNPVTGARVWRTQLTADDSYWFQYPPVWSAGVLYAQAGYSGAVLAVRATDGHLLWHVKTRVNGHTPLMVDDQGVWAAFDNVAYQVLDPATGKERRHFSTVYNSGSGNPPVLALGCLWMRDDTFGYTLTAVDEKTGKTVRSLPATSTPAFDSAHAYVSSNGVLRALDAKTFTTKWMYTNASGVADVRLIADGYVYVENGDGLLRALQADTGATAWSVRVAPDPGPGATSYEEDDSRGLTVPGIGTAHGRLVVPDQFGHLTAYVAATN